MYDPDEPPREIENLIQVGVSVYFSAIKTVVFWLVSGLVYGILIGKIEIYFYEFPYMTLGLWLFTGWRLLLAYERGNI